MNFLRTRCTNLRLPRYYDSLRSIGRCQSPALHGHVSRQIHSSRIFARELNPQVSPLEKEKEILILKERLFSDVPPKPKTARPITFTLAVALFGFGFAAIATNEETDKWRMQTYNLFLLPGEYSDQMYAAWRANEVKSWNLHISAFQRKIAGLTLPVRNFAQTSYHYIAQSWVNLTEGRATCYKLVGCFAAVYLITAFPFTRSLGRRLFSHDPLSGSTFTLLTSQFGHANFLHLALNSYCFIGFGEAAWNYLRSQQIHTPGNLDEAFSQYHFLAFHIVAGTFSALVSHLISTRYQLPRLVSALAKGPVDTMSTTTRLLPRSLGASGAIYASVVVAALAFPHASLQIALLPFFQFSIATGVCSLVALDIVGLIRGWRYLDHAAHLGGAAFGAAYYYVGPATWEKFRREMYEVPSTARTGNEE